MLKNDKTGTNEMITLALLNLELYIFTNHVRIRKTKGVFLWMIFGTFMLSFLPLLAAYLGALSVVRYDIKKLGKKIVELETKVEKLESKINQQV